MTVEEHCGHREAEAMLLRKLAGVEVVSGRRKGVNGVSRFLPEEDEHVAVDADDRLWGLIADHFSACILKF